MSASIDPRELRNALGAFLTGVTVVTTYDASGAPRGFTANSFTSVSLDPPLILVCVGKGTGSHPVFEGASGFAVNVLGEHQREISARFASRIPDRFAGAPWEDGPAGHPVLPGAAAWFDCTTDQVVDAGDHLVLIGRVQGFDHSQAGPLGYLRGSYVTLGLAADALAHPDAPTRVGAVLEHDGALLLVEDLATGRVGLPTGRSLGRPEEPTSLRGVLRALGVQVALGFLYAVYDDADGTTCIFHRGEVIAGPPPSGPARLYPLNDIPWAALGDEAIASMLRRYVAERHDDDRFGIYVGDARDGMVRHLGDARGG